MAYIGKNMDRGHDTELRLKDSGSAVVADTLAVVGGSTATIDLGTGVCRFDLVIDVSALDVAQGDELYRMQLIGCNSSAFGSAVVNLGEIVIGDSTQLAASVGGVDTDRTTGRHVGAFYNQIGTTAYRYVRLVANLGGTSPSITYTAFLANVQAA